MSIRLQADESYNSFLILGLGLDFGLWTLGLKSGIWEGGFFLSVFICMYRQRTGIGIGIGHDYGYEYEFQYGRTCMRT